MSFQRVWRLRILKKKMLPGVQLSTKAINVKKPVRYTSIKKAKPKTIADIAQILQQITKENKEREQKPEATFSTEPATSNQYNAGIEYTNKTFSTSKVHAFSNFSAKVASTLVENEPAWDFSDREAKAEDEQKKSASMTGACESVAAHDLPQETDVISSYDIERLFKIRRNYVTTSFTESDARTETVQTYNSANTKVMATPAALKQIEVLEDVLDSTVYCHSTQKVSEVTSSEVADNLRSLMTSHHLLEMKKIVGVEDGEVHGNAPSSNNTKEPAVVHTEVLEEKLRTDTVEESPVARLGPIQRLFLDKIREYSAKSKSSGGLVDAAPEYERAFNEELAKLDRLYGGRDLTNFPKCNFCGGCVYIYEEFGSKMSSPCLK